MRPGLFAFAMKREKWLGIVLRSWEIRILPDCAAAERT